MWVTRATCPDSTTNASCYSHHICARPLSPLIIDRRIDNALKNDCLFAKKNSTFSRKSNNLIAEFSNFYLNKLFFRIINYLLDNWWKKSYWIYSIHQKYIILFKINNLQNSQNHSWTKIHDTGWLLKSKKKLLEMSWFTNEKIKASTAGKFLNWSI